MKRMTSKLIGWNIQAIPQSHNPLILCDIFRWKQLKMAEYCIRRAGGRAELELEKIL
jgi:hypothetical protein